jgi:putative ABC transport system permease protein
MKIPIKLGRAFTASDSSGAAPVAIVNEELASAFPNGNPIGQRIPLAILDSHSKTYEIVGVAGNIRLGDRVAPRVFVPLAQAPPYWIDLVFRADTGDRSLPDVRRALRSMSADLLLENESSFRTIIANSLALERTQTAFAVMIGSLATIVTAIGLYALMTFVTAQRRRELGIRLALGSAPRQLFYQAMSGALRLVAIGVVLGMVTTAVLVRVIGSRVFGLSSADPFAYAAASVLVLGVSVAAVWIPARRVMRTDPLIAIRQD